MKIAAIVEYAHCADSDVVQWCRLKPLMQIEEDAWQPVQDRESRFPTQGLVFWYEPPPGALEDTLWSVDVAENPLSDGRDKFTVEHGTPMAGFLPVESSGPELRRAIAAGRFRLRRPPPGLMYLSRPDRSNQWLGPLAFRADRDGRTWAVEKVPVGFLEVLQVEDADLARVTHPLANLMVLQPGRTLPRPVESWNVQDDSTLLSSLLKNVRRLDPAVAEALGLTQRVWKAYVEAVTRAGAESHRSHDLARIEAVRDLLERHEADVVGSEELFHVLLEHPRIKEWLEQSITEEVQRSKPEVQRRVEGEISDLVERREELEKRLEEMRATMSERESQQRKLELQISDAEGALGRIEEELNERVRATLEEVASDPMGKLLDHLIVRALVDGSAGSRSKPHPRSSVRSSEGPAAELGECGELLSLIRSEFVAMGVDQDVGLSIVGGWLSGKLVTCRGERALAALLGVGRHVAGNAIWLVPVPARVFGLEDLLSLRATRVAAAEQALLADVLEGRREDRYPTVIVLHGMNRAPPAHVLEDLTMDLELGGVGMLQPSSVASPVRNRVEGRTSVLWSGTMVSGRTTWAIDRSVAVRLHLVDADRESMIPRDKRPTRSPTVHRILWPLAASEADSSVRTPCPDAVAHEEAEVRRFLSCFNESERGIAEWLVARGVPRWEDEELLRFAEEAGQASREHIERLQASGVVEHLRALIDWSHDE